MASLQRILAEKGDEVLSIHPGASVLEAARQMNAHRVGSLMVVDRDRLLGIITERDVLVRVVAQRRDPANTPVLSVMTRDLVVADLSTTVDEARATMRNRRIRHLPVVDDAGGLLGLVSIGDLNAHQLNGHEQTIASMQEYILGRT